MSLRSLTVVTLTVALFATTLVAPALAASPPLVPGESTGDDPDEEWWEGIVVPETGVLPAHERHPSLYFAADDIPEIRARALGQRPDPHGFHADNWARVVADADSWLDEPVSSNDDVKTRAAKALSFAWVVTGDQRYRDHAVANLQAAFAELQQTDQYVAMQMTNYAVAYDWVLAEGVADDVSPIPEGDVQAMREAIKVGADWMDDYLDSPGVRSHNHRSKVAAAQGTWAMAFAEDPDAQAYLDKGMANLNRVWSYMFTEDGIHRDGAGYYWIFTVINSTPFLWHYKNAAGQDLFPLLQPAFEWQLRTSNPKGWTPNVEDGWYKHTWLVTVAAAYAETPTELSATASLGELFQWRFFATDHEPVRYPDDFTGARNQYYGWPDEIVLYDPSLAEVQPDADTGTVDFDAGPRGGATVFRSDWDFAEPHTRWGYFEGTAMSNNHDHADALQFLVEAENTILANDNGFGPQRFSGRNEWKGPEHHNVITADGAALGDPGPTAHFLDTGFFDFAEKSATYHDDQDARHTRGLAFPGQDYFVVVDRLAAATDKTWVSRYHNRGEAVGAGPRWQWTTAAGPWGDAARMHAFVLPGDAAVATAEGRFNPYGDGSNHAGPQYPDPSTDVEDVTKLELTQTGTDAQYLKVLVPGAVDAAAPAFDDLSAGDTLAARVTTDQGVDLFASRPAAGSLGADTLAADATFVWTRQVGDQLQHLAGRHLTALSFAGDEVVTSDQPVALALDVSDPRAYTGQVARDTDGPTVLTVRLPAGRDLAGATLDGAAVDATVSADAVHLELDGGGDLVVAFTAATDPPETPAGLTAEPTSGGIELTWNGAAGATGYDVLRTADDGDTEVVATVTAPAHRDAEVAAGTAYTYAVAARNEAGASEPSAPVTVTAGPVAPRAPTGLHATPSDSQVQLSWNRSIDADRYVVLRASGDDPLAPVATVTDTAYHDAGLTNGTTYRYAIVAENDVGASDPSDQITASPFAEAPDAPTGLRSARGAGEVTLSWDPTPRADTYDVLRATGDDGFAPVAEGLTEPSYTDADVVDGAIYAYVVHATNASGTSPASREAVAIPGCTPTIAVAADQPNYLEAEDHAVLAGAFEPHEDPDRSGGVYLQSQGGSGAGSAPTGDDYLRFDLEVDEPGAYRLWLLAQGDDSSSDSFWIQVDRQEPFQAIMDNSRQWRWKTAASVAHLDGGFQTLTVHHREAGARIDKLLLVRDTSYTPTGLGGDATAPSDCPGECVDAYPVNGTDLSFVEAEGYQEISGDLAVVEDAERSGGAYLQAAASAPKDDPDTDAWAAYDLDVSVAGDYRMLALGYGPDSDSDSFWVAVDDDPPSAQFNFHDTWSWRLSTSANRVTLPEGRVRLYLKARKPGTNVDKFLLTMSGHTPSGHGGDALPRPDCEDDTDPEPQPPPAPTGLSAAHVDGGISLRWDAVDDVDHYRVLRTQAVEGGYEMVADEVTETTFVDRDVVDTESYTYAVAAVDREGVSPRSVTATVTAGCTPTYTLVGDEHRWIEAETPSARVGDWLEHEDDGRSAGRYLQLDPDAVKGALEDDWLRYDLDVSDAGAYAVWLLGWSGGTEASNTFWLQVDGEALVRANIEVPDWGWRNPVTVTLTEGRHTLWLRNREPNAMIDKLLVTADAAYRPAGLGDDATAPVGCGPCPIPDLRPTVVIRDEDTGVPNRDSGDGCTINDLIDDRRDERSHGEFVDHVSEVTEQLVDDGVITGRERSRIVSVAARRR